MTTSRKKILKTLVRLEGQIHHQQKEIYQEKLCINQSIQKAKSALPLLLIPALIVGWKISRKGIIKPLLKHLVEIGSIAAVSSFKKEIIKSFSR